MYQNLGGATAPALAATGAAAAYYAIGAWTLILAGVALIYTARVLYRRAKEQRR